MVSAALCFLALVILGFVLTFVVPKFAGMFQELGLEEQYLPALTRAVLAASGFTVNWWYLLLPVLLGVPCLVSRVPRERAWIVEIVMILVLGAIVGVVIIGLFSPQITGGMVQLETEAPSR
jgi:type II secretory pathway component PulF